MHRKPIVLAALAAALVAAAPAPLRAQTPSPLDEARAAYQARVDAAQARHAVTLFEQIAKADPTSYEARWEGARAVYYLGTYPMEDAADADRMALFDRGIALARQAIALKPDGVEGHFWLGVLLGVYGEAKGIFKSLSLVPDIRKEMETCLKLDPSVEGYGPDRVLGRMLYKLPWFKGGDNKESRAHLERSLAGAPTNALTKLYLAETLKSLGDKPAALKQLDEIVAMTPDPRWAPEHPVIVRRAQRLIDKWR